VELSLGFLEPYMRRDRISTSQCMIVGTIKCCGCECDYDPTSPDPKSEAEDGDVRP